jgi:hypothetical protein
MANDRDDLNRKHNLEDEDTLDEREGTTGEVGSEGGSPGERVKTERQRMRVSPSNSMDCPWRRRIWKLARIDAR